MDDIEVNDARFRDALQSVLREIQGKRTDENMAKLLMVEFDAYKKWKNRLGSQFPAYKLPHLALIAAISLDELFARIEAIARASRERKKPA